MIIQYDIQVFLLTKIPSVNGDSDSLCDCDTGHYCHRRINSQQKVVRGARYFRPNTDRRWTRFKRIALTTCSNKFSEKHEVTENQENRYILNWRVQIPAL